MHAYKVNIMKEMRSNPGQWGNCISKEMSIKRAVLAFATQWPMFHLQNKKNTFTI